MNEQHFISRRLLVRSSVFGFIGVAMPNILLSNNLLGSEILKQGVTAPHDRYPAIASDVASEVVGVSHFNLERLKELVEPRPELAKANWDWGFGDWESAIGAASHTGRKDITGYLISKGAIPTIFTYAMLGAFDAVKAMIAASPGVQKNFGPHGISLLQHAKLSPETEGVDKAKAQQLIEYLENLGDADGTQYLKVEEADKEKYLGDYKYGDGKDDGFTIRLNMKKGLSLGKLGKFGGALYKVAENDFIYNGAPSVHISFKTQNNKIVSLTISEPSLVITANRI